MNLHSWLRCFLFVAFLVSRRSAHEHSHHFHQAKQDQKDGNMVDKKKVSPHDRPSSAADKGGTDGMKHDGHDHYKCGIADPTIEEVAHIHRLVAEYKVSKDVSEEDFRVDVTVPICFHVIMTTSGDGELTDEQLQLQVDALNVAFSSDSCCDDFYSWCDTGSCSSDTGFRFEMDPACTTRTVNNDWYYADPQTDDDAAMKQTLRVGGPDVLNIYFQSLSGGLLGSAWFPWWIDDAIWRDGINILNRAIVGGDFGGYTEGAVLAHEVGHWLGVYHTFQWGCSPSEGVVDTNPEASAAKGCPIGRDTCRGGNVGDGLDPIHNFMDYTDDYCKFEFTADQIDVMHVSHAVYRAERVTRNEILTLVEGVSSEPLTLAQEEMQVYRYSLETAGASVNCVISYIDEVTGAPCTANCFNGDAELFLRWGEQPNRFVYDCASELSGSFESCTSPPGPGDSMLYVGVYAYWTFLDVVTTCSEIANLIPLANNTASSPVSLTVGTTQTFYLAVTSPRATLTCSSSGEDGNADLFLNFDRLPDIDGDLYDCSSAGYDSDEECTLADRSMGTAFVSMYAQSTFSDLTVTCYEVDTFTSDAIELENGVGADSLSLRTDEEQYYVYPLQFPDNPGSIFCTTAGSNGDADVLLKWVNPPVRDGRRDCISESSSSNERCDLRVPSGASSLYILVYAYSSFTNLRVACFETPTTTMPTLAPTVTAGPSVVASHVPTNRPTTSPAPTALYGAIVLRNGVPSDLLSLSTDDEQYYRYPLEYPDRGGSVTCATVGTNGDADFVLKWGEPLVRGGTVDCTSESSSSNERCDLDIPNGASSLYVLVYAFSGFTNLRVTCFETPTATLAPTVTAGPSVAGSNVPTNRPTTSSAPTVLSGATVIRNGVSSAFLSLSTDDEQYYRYPLEFPDAGGIVSCTTAGSNGDADFSLKWGDPPVRGGSADCIGVSSSSNERCDLDVPFGISNLHILVYAFRSFTNLRVTCTETVPVVLRSGVESEPLSLSTGDEQYYRYPMEFPDARGIVTCTTVGSSGDADLVLKWDDLPVRGGSVDCISEGSTSNERCDLDISLGSSSLYILVYAFSSFTNLRVTCSETLQLPVVLQNWVPSELLSLSTGDGQYYVYPVELPHTEGSVTCTTAGSSGDADLALKWDDSPVRGGDVDCISEGSTSNELCALDVPYGASDLYILVYAFTSFTDLRVTCTETPGSATENPSNNPVGRRSVSPSVKSSSTPSIPSSSEPSVFLSVSPSSSTAVLTGPPSPLPLPVASAEPSSPIDPIVTCNRFLGECSVGEECCSGVCWQFGRCGFSLW